MEALRKSDLDIRMGRVKEITSLGDMIAEL